MGRPRRRRAPAQAAADLYAVNLPEIDGDHGPIDFDEGLGVEEDLVRPSVKRERLHKRGAGSRYKAAGIDFDEGLDVVDLRKAAAAPAAAPRKDPKPPNTSAQASPGGKAPDQTTDQGTQKAPQGPPKPGAGTRVQTLIMDKGRFPTAAAAKKWAADNGFRANSVDETENSFRLRQADPGGFDRLRTITLTEGVKAVVGPPKTKTKKDALGVDEFLAHRGEVPGVLTWEAVRKGELPTDDAGAMVSGLPPSLEADVPPAFRWWKCASQDEALRVREALVEAQIFRPETIRDVNGEPRRAVAEAVVKLYLPPTYPDDQGPEIPPAIRPVEKAAQLLKTTEEDTPTTLFDQNVVEAVGLKAIASKVGKLQGEWVICAKDTTENRKAIGGPSFRLLSRDDLIFATNADLEDPDAVEWVTDSRPAEVLKYALQDDREIRLIKAEGEERIVFGVVLEPDEVDSQGDTISQEEIRQACHKFMEDFGQLGLQHKEIVNGKLKLLENFVAPVPFDVDGQSVKAGSWLMKERVVDDSLWKAVKKGELTGFSIGGSAIRRPVKR